MRGWRRSYRCVWLLMWGWGATFVELGYTGLMVEQEENIIEDGDLEGILESEGAEDRDSEELRACGE